MQSKQETVTRVLRRVEEGDRDALDSLFELVYDELRELARRQRRRWRGDHTLGTTALVHEAYLKLVGQERLGTESRAHFLALAGRAMRHILSNYARHRRAQKRGGALSPASLDEAAEVVADVAALSPERAETLLALDAALTRLERMSERQSRIVECRFYAGLTVPETAAALGVSPATVKREWALAQAWLYREMQRA